MSWTRIVTWGAVGVGVLIACAAGRERGAMGGTVKPSPAVVPDMATEIAVFEADRGALGRFYELPGSPTRVTRLTRWLDEWEARLAALDFEALASEGRVDWLLLRSELEGERARLALEERRAREDAALVPYAARIQALCEARQRVEPLAGDAAASALDALTKEVEALCADTAEEPAEKAAEPATTPALALRAARRDEGLAEHLRDWYEFRAGYDPDFTWWLRAPHEALQSALAAHARHLRTRRAGLAEDDDETIVGDPVGREALLADLRLAWIPYTPEELLEAAERELAWCEAELLAAAREMGCGDDWKAALERVKQRHVAPGEQPALIVALAREAWDYVEAEGLVTVPPLAKEVWRVNMLSPERQRTSPFFLGGESILVAFPTDAMSHEEKLMSLRGNNRHFCRATVHHEVIPGHHLQMFATQRAFPHRAPFATPFWTEGWALWWEMLLYERGFVAAPEDRVGALFWRMHRCARVRFSLDFHLGRATPAQCVELLVERVGHERENAEAEVRRSFGGDYGPLYQLAYLTGALQFRALYAELVRSGRMTARAFHDAVLAGGNMPVELVRARLAGLELTREPRTGWRFLEAAAPR
jgi:hypothetical protein